MVKGQWPACDMRQQRGVFPGGLGVSVQGAREPWTQGDMQWGLEVAETTGERPQASGQLSLLGPEECGEGSMGGPVGGTVLPEREQGVPHTGGQVVSCSEEGETRQPEKPGRGQRKPEGPSHATWRHPQPAWCPVLLCSQGLGRGDVHGLAPPEGHGQRPWEDSGMVFEPQLFWSEPPTHRRAAREPNPRATVPCSPQTPLLLGSPTMASQPCPVPCPGLSQPWATGHQAGSWRRGAFPAAEGSGLVPGDSWTHSQGSRKAASHTEKPQL